MDKAERRRRRREERARAKDQPDFAAGEEIAVAQEEASEHDAASEQATTLREQLDLAAGAPDLTAVPEEPSEPNAPTMREQLELPTDEEPVVATQPFTPEVHEDADEEPEEIEPPSAPMTGHTVEMVSHPEVVPSENGGEESRRPPDFAPPVSGPGAVAQVLATASPGATRFAEPESRGTEPDPFFRPPSPQPEWHEPEAVAVPAAGAVRPEAPSPLPPPRPANPPPARDGSWTREPVLFALLLAALIVLAFTAYQTMRLNGLSDRLAALAAKPQVAALAPGAAAQDRPWVGLDTIRNEPFANGGRPVTTVHFGNSGAEPAYDFRSNTVGSLRSAKMPAPDLPAQPGPVASSGVLLPNAGGTLTFFANTRPLTPQEAASIRAGQDVLWLAGRLDYKDGRGRIHETTFRYRFNPSLNGFTAAPEGNTAN